MNYTRHKLGGGKIFNQGFACEQSYLSPCSTVNDEAEVYDSYIKLSHIWDRARIVRSELFMSSVAGRARIWGGAHLSKVDVRDHAAINNARIVGNNRIIEITDMMWIDRGEWHRAPRYVPIISENIQVGLTECIEGRMHIGCRCLTFEEWTRAGYRERIGRIAGWTPMQIELAYDTFTTWHHNPIPT